MKRVALLAVLLLAGAHGAWCVEVLNGSFEDGTNSWTVSASDTNPPACAVGDSEGCTDGTYAMALSGLNLAGNAVLEQTLATVSGAVYAVRFDHGAFANAGRAQVLRAEALDGATLLAGLTVTAFGPGSASAAFTTRTNTFTAASAFTTIRFIDQTTLANSQNCDGLLDRVRASGTVAVPVIAPYGGLHAGPVEVTLSCATEGAQIAYTLDGLTPTTNSPAYGTPFTLSSNATVKALAWMDGLDDSAVASAVFTISDLPLVATPTIAPNGGEYLEEVDVTLACATAGAAIRYTTDGSAPATNSATYSAPLVLTSDATVKAIASMAGMADSDLASAAFRVLPPGSVRNGSFESGTNGWTVTATDANPPACAVDSSAGASDGTNAMVFGRLNAPGNGVIEQALTTVSGAVYTVWFDYAVFGLRNKTQALRAEALDGATVLAARDATAVSAVDVLDPAAVVFRPQSNTFSAVSASTLIRFTDQTTPANGTSGDGALDAVHITGMVAAPAMSPDGGMHVGSVDVTLTCATDGATIAYTTDGSAPGTNSTPYTAPFTLTSNTTVKAVAWRTGLADSAVSSATFTVTPMPLVATPTITPDGGAFLDLVDVTLACDTPDATIAYTTDDSTPTTNSAAYSAPLSLTSNTTIRAMAWKAAMSDSAVTSATFAIFSDVLTPTISPDGGPITGSVTVTLACDTPGSTIRYTSDGSDPGSVAGTYLAYSAPFRMGSGTVKAYSTHGGYTNSAVVSATFSNSVDESWAGIALPGRVEAEHYRAGEEGSAYHDVDPANNGHVYRADGVDLQPCDDAGGGYNVGWTVFTEWMEYDIHVTHAGDYDFIFRLASAAAGIKTVSALVDSVTVATVDIPYTNGYEHYHDAMIAGVPLAAGDHVLRVYFNTPNLTFNYLDITTRTARIAVPGRIEAENFKPGGQGVGYFENLPHRNVNLGGAYRLAEGVDIETCRDSGGGYNVGHTDLAGEWLAYNIRVARGVPHDITFRVASATEGIKTLRAEVDGLPVATGTFDFADGWQAFHDVTIRGVQLAAGDHELKILFDTESINLNYVDITEYSGMMIVIR
ncbi:MAG: chitobiase/beta-hexosaminidase C-terminal domain-containing protein [Lentisphaerae bacterium]|nr:chitobiase/beta-hexosaminidase C-terminal domain-containing protein [Lentisphaerota bacterium]